MTCASAATLPAQGADDRGATASEIPPLQARRARGHPWLSINGTSTAALAEQFDTTPGAIYKSLHDARLKVLTAQLEPAG